MNNIGVEKYAWVDALISEMCNNCLIQSDDCDDAELSELFNDNYEWVDRLVQADVSNQTLSDVKLSGVKRKRAESDISNYNDEVERAVKRVRYSSPEDDYWAMMKEFCASISDERDETGSQKVNCPESFDYQEMDCDEMDVDEYDGTGYDSY
jgi:hypothetical protein